MTTHTDPREHLAELLRSQPMAQAEIEAAEQALRDDVSYFDNDPSGQQAVDEVYAEFDREQDVLTARAALHAEVHNIDRSLSAFEAAAGELVRCYDADYVEGDHRAKIEAAVLHMRVLLDGIRHNLPDAD
jgi:hypothetical protein